MMKFWMLYYINLMSMMLMINLIINSIPYQFNKIHPLIMMLILFFLLIMSSISLNIYFNNNWFSYIMFLMMIGGMMIIFMYFTSFISNMKISINWSMLINMPIKFIMMLMFLILFMKVKDTYFNWNNNYNEINSLIINYNINKINNIMYMYTYNKNFSTLICIIYLLICLTMIVKIMLFKTFTLRKIN
uniref:NADH dehydrogenase subunit 6 n=1 Tax=Philotrypesis pilosa TaxID=358048 RepID=G8EEK5_9HYME|nr:NADH dehydrogenase subunit 6 [Philotrypesis pilosa]